MGATPFEEWKRRETAAKAEKAARETAYSELLKQREGIHQRIEYLSDKDSRWWPERSHLQNQLLALDRRIQLLSEARERERQEEEINSSQYGRFIHTVRTVLNQCLDRTCLLSELQEDLRVQREWRNLVMSRIVRKSAEMKEVLLQRSSAFEIYADAEGRQALRFTGESGTTSMRPVTSLPSFPALVRPPESGLWVEGPGQMPMLAPNVVGGQMTIASPSTSLAIVPQGVVGGVCTALPMQRAFVDLRPDQVLQVEAMLLKAGGSERFRRISLSCGAQEPQLARFFRLYEEAGKTFVTHTLPERGKLENLLLHLNLSRMAIREAMAFCMDHALQHAGVFALSLVRSLEVEDLRVEQVLARMYLISDVLYNSNSGARGAASFRVKFEELLPDACERLGRLWLPALEAEEPEREKAGMQLRHVLAAWRSWDVFPSVFIGGLEALLLAPAPDPATELAAIGPESESDPMLRQKLTRWCHEVEPAEVRLAAKRRGLAGPNLSVATCRLRFCHYERYWNKVDVVLIDALQIGHESCGEFLDTASIDGESLSDGDPATMEAELQQMTASLPMASGVSSGPMVSKRQDTLMGDDRPRKRVEELD